MRILCKRRLPHHYKCIDAFIEGLNRDTVRHEIHYTTPTEPPSGSYDFAVCWGAKQMNFLKDYTSSKNVLIFENAYLNNVQTKDKEWISLGWNGLNGRADFCNQDSPPDRWEKHFNDGRLLDYTDGKYVLLTLQIAGDQSLAKVRVNYQMICDTISKYTDMEICVRDHPTRPNTQPKLFGVRYLDYTMPIEDAIKGAKVVVTVNSNSGVDAILAGKPVINLDKGSMVWDIAAHDFEKVDKPQHMDRTQWCNDIAYTQWNPSELRSGEAWNHVKKKLTWG